MDRYVNLSPDSFPILNEPLMQQNNMIRRAYHGGPIMHVELITKQGDEVRDKLNKIGVAFPKLYLYF